ncbi:MAG: DUF4166 domain-containing protein [Reyranellaceae bacterium]
MLGATGLFGARVCRLLARDPAIEITAVARDCAKLKALRREIGIAIAAFDLAGDWRAPLQATRADLVIHTAGPFQARDYAVAEACIAMGAHYIDLADARGFVAGIGALDQAARSAGVLVASGASSVPALSSAVIDRLRDGLATIEAIDIAITPGNRAPRGRATVASILSYVGRPLRWWRGGRWAEVAGWHDLHRRSLPTLGRRWFSACDVPDLELFPAHYQVRDRVLFHAGLELSLLHLGLWLLSWPVRWRWMRSWAPAAGAIAWLADLVRAFGTDRGGMAVDVAGRRADGRAVIKRWRLIAEAGDGPWVPSLAAVALAHGLARGTVAQRGARPCIGLLALEDILAVADGLAIRTSADEIDPVYERVCGRQAYALLPAPIRALHDNVSRARWSGRADVVGAANPLAFIAARLVGLPRAARNVDVAVEFEVRDGVERWQRSFGGRPFVSLQYAGEGADAGTVIERFGALSFALRNRLGSEGLSQEIAAAYVLGIRLPQLFWPRVHARERLDGQGRFTFSVGIAVPLLGRLVAYEGWLAPTSSVARD